MSIADNIPVDDTTSDGPAIAAARWFVAEWFRVVAEKVEGCAAPWPTVPEACRRFNVTNRGDDAVVLRAATEFKERVLASMPPLVGMRDPIKELAQHIPSHPGVFRNYG